MKKFLIVAILGFSLQSITQAQYYEQANNWYQKYTKRHSNKVKNLFADYAFSRVEEIDSWIRLQRKDLSKTEYEIAQTKYKMALKRKNISSFKLMTYTNAFLGFEAIRNEGNKIMHEAFKLDEYIPLSLEYKLGKLIIATTAKRNFFFECYKLLEIQQDKA